MRSGNTPIRAATRVPAWGPQRFFLCLLALLLPLAVSGQTIRGTVTDGGRKALEGVAVRLVQQETNRPRQALTDPRGEFTISNLAPGEYRIEAERDGYARQVRQFELLLNQDVTVEISLLAGLRKDTVQVTAVADVLPTGTAALGGVVDNRHITGLPLDGRNRSEEHTSELQSPCNLVCRLLLEKKKNKTKDSERSPRQSYTRVVTC